MYSSQYSRSLMSAGENFQFLVLSSIRWRKRRACSSLLMYKQELHDADAVLGRACARIR